MKVGVTYSNPAKLDPYLEALRAVGLDPEPIHYDEPAKIAGLDGLVIGGGPDLDPQLYGQTPDGSDEPVRRRDTLELALLGQALEKHLPLLCICRGMQMFNVFHGGTLYQHLASAGIHRQVRAETAHDIEIEQGSTVGRAIGGSNHTVNSRHHQGVDRVGRGLIVSARSSDGIVEALDRPDRPMALAVQWHPEDRVQASDRDRALFVAFARSVLGRA